VREDSQKSAAILRERIGETPLDVGLILGTRLAGIADNVGSPVVSSYAELPGFALPRVDGQDAQCVIGTLGTARVAILKGRTHYHETGDIGTMRVPLETLSLLGAKAVVLTSAAGSTRREISPGLIAVIRDHINLTGRNPLIGEADDRRFLDLTAAYDTSLRERFAVAAGEVGRKTVEATYMWFPGPTFETPAEINAARQLGADLVGMSTVPEVIMARHLGLRVLGVAMVTNFAAGVGQDPPGHEQTMRVASATIVSLTRVLTKFFEIWKLESTRVRA
jgi:purine-nucleoside phosphorylase